MSSQPDGPRPTFTLDQIRGFYDRNTPAFVALGQGGNLGAIHRAVWGPGVTSRDEAFHYVEDRLVDLLAREGATDARVIDLGCGVAASLCYLASQRPGLTGVGVTLSGVQARLARERIERAGLSTRLACVEADFCALPADLRAADLVYAIESFVHGPDPRRFLQQCRAALKPGGLLAICDDFRRAGGAGSGGTIDRFRRGWRINSLIPPEELRALAKDAGLEHRSTTDLTPFLELNRPRDRMIAGLAALAGWLPLYRTRLGHLLGGSALQRCLSRGWIGYDLALFQRVG